MKQMKNSQISKSILAKLLATEDITVQYQKVQTASFDIVNRRLTLPVWNDVTPEMTDLLVGHEVGHAIDTPQEYVTAAKAGAKGFSTFLNVIEDARIEKKIKNLYPGLRKPFATAYRQFVERDFFQIKNLDVNQMLLIDRINLHFKIGAFSNINFDSNEMLFVKEIETLETFEQVLDITNRIFAYCQDELAEKQREAEEEFNRRKEAGEFDDEFNFEDDDGMNDEDDYEDRNPFDSDSDSDDSSEDSVDDYDNGYSNAPTFESTKPKELSQYNDEVKSITDEKLQENLKGLAETKQINVGKLANRNKIPLKNYIIPFKELTFFDSSFYDEDLSPDERYDYTLLTKFESKNKNAITYLVKEFEMKKKAAELRRVTVSDTGTLDTNKLHTYKFNDDIFRKIGSVAAGKNHGIVMFIDWSGSMSDNMSGTIEQLITMTSFCRKVNIPFDVYAFSTQYYQGRQGSNPLNTIVWDENDIPVDNFSLLNILSSSMKNQTYRKFANDLLNYGSCYLPYNNHRRNHKISYVTSQLGLGGTPLNSTIQLAPVVVNAFQKRTRTEIVNVIFLTDGEDATTLWTECKDGRGIRLGPSDRSSISYIEDTETCKKYRISAKGVTPTLLEILKDKTECNLIGFYIIPKSKNYFRNAMSRFNIIYDDVKFKKYKEQKFYAINDYGYDEYFLIPGGADLTTEDDSLDDILGDTKDVSSRKLKGAFLKMNQNRLTNRVLLSKVIEEIA
jgi:hypothetical protein